MKSGSDKRPKVRRWLMGLLPLAAAAVALWLLHRQLSGYDPGAIVDALLRTATSKVLVAALLTVVSYLALTGYDRLALGYVHSGVPYRRSAPISLIAYGVGNSLGFPLFTSTPLRFRLYSAAGLQTTDIVRVISFIIVTFWSGLLALGGLLLCFRPASLGRVSGLSPLSLQAGGTVMLLLVVAYLGSVWRRREPLRLGSWTLELPRLPLAVSQVVLGALDAVLTALVLWALIPKSDDLDLPTFLAAYVLAQLLGLVSHVPGGLGVLEATLLTLLAGSLPAHDLLGALLLFRAIYYLAPLALSVTLLVVLERRTLRELGETLEREASPWLGPVVPPAMAVATFLAGALLITSGSLPEIGTRLNMLGRVVPLALLETSHLLSGVLGLMLLVLARGLRRRLDGAWHVTVWMLAASIVFVLMRGLDWVEATLLSSVLLLLVLSKRHFYRRASLLSRPFSPRWLLAVGIVLASGVWLGLVAYDNADHSQQHFWQFSLSGDLPRFLRVQVALATTLAVYGTMRMLSGAKPQEARTTADELESVEAVVASSPRTATCLALLGDKHFLFDGERTAFVMYGISGDSWIALGDPVGPVEHWPELVWRFRELCDLYDERPVFYQIRPDNLAIYLDAGLTVLKLGEAARTSLESFSLEGGARRDLRKSLSRAEREGLAFEVVAKEDVPTLLPQLRAISDEWLEEKNVSEKGFSLGFFDDRYLEHFPIATVRREGKIVAFANVLLAAEHEEVSVDLMRHTGDSPYGVMDYLFVQLMLWGRDQGYRYFHLGMAPLAGLEQHPLAPLWNRLGAWMFRNGEHFYNFQGLRSYKEKFTPEWEPRYLAAPDGLATSRALLDVATLISGGLKGLVSR